MKENTLNRIKQYIDYKLISVRAFEVAVGMSNGSFASQLKNNKTIGVDRIENILYTYPEINPEWLLTGKGDMLKTETPTYKETKKEIPKKTKVAEDVTEYNNENIEITSLKEKIVSLEKQIELLKENLSSQKENITFLKEISNLKDLNISKLEKQIEHLKKLLSAKSNKRRASSGE